MECVRTDPQEDSDHLIPMSNTPASPELVTLTLTLVTRRPEAERLLVRLNTAILQQAAHILEHSSTIVPLTPKVLQTLSASERSLSSSHSTDPTAQDAHGPQG